jgi:membrane protease YdiL (CAAX protease family)
MGSIAMDMYMTAGVGVVALLLGMFFTRTIPVLKRLCIPAPVSGGLLVSLLALAVHAIFKVDLDFDGTFKDLCMMLFFTSVGFQSDMRMLKRGGKPLVTMVALVALLIVVQNLLSVGIAGPVTEELFFRGVLLRTLSKANQRFAIVASAVFFGLFHGNIQQFILATLLGIFLTHITLKHGSIIPSIIVHAFVNTTAGIVGFFAGLGTASSVLTYLALLGAALVGVIMLLVFNSRDKLPSTTPAQARRGIAVAAGSLPFIAAVVVLTAETVLNLMSKK